MINFSHIRKHIYRIFIPILHIRRFFDNSEAKFIIKGLQARKLFLQLPCVINLNLLWFSYHFLMFFRNLFFNCLVYIFSRDWRVNLQWVLLFATDVFLCDFILDISVKCCFNKLKAFFKIQFLLRRHWGCWRH